MHAWTLWTNYVCLGFYLHSDWNADNHGFAAGAQQLLSLSSLQIKWFNLYFFILVSKYFLNFCVPLKNLLGESTAASCCQSNTFDFYQSLAIVTKSLKLAKFYIVSVGKDINADLREAVVGDQFGFRGHFQTKFSSSFYRQKDHPQVFPVFRELPGQNEHKMTVKHHKNCKPNQYGLLGNLIFKK